MIWDLLRYQFSFDANSDWERFPKPNPRFLCHSETQYIPATFVCVEVAHFKFLKAQTADLYD